MIVHRTEHMDQKTNQNRHLCCQRPKIIERRRGPRHTQPRSGATPKHASQRATKNNMIRIFKSLTQCMKLRGWPVTFPDLVSCRQSATHDLPRKDYNFKRISSLPNPVELYWKQSLVPIYYEETWRRSGRLGVRLNHRINRLQECRKDSNEMVPILQLFGRQHSAKTKIPIPSWYIRDGDPRIRTIRKQWRKDEQSGPSPSHQSNQN